MSKTRRLTDSQRGVALVGYLTKNEDLLDLPFEESQAIPDLLGRFNRDAEDGPRFGLDPSRPVDVAALALLDLVTLGYGPNAEPITFLLYEATADTHGVDVSDVSNESWESLEAGTAAAVYRRLADGLRVVADNWEHAPLRSTKEVRP